MKDQRYILLKFDYHNPHGNKIYVIDDHGTHRTCRYGYYRKEGMSFSEFIDTLEWYQSDKTVFEIVASKERRGYKRLKTIVILK
jgi:hypothetical protein